MKSWISCVLIALMSVFLVLRPITAGSQRIIRPTRDIKDVILSPSAWDELSKLPDIDMNLALGNYIAGFWDAIVLVESKAPAIQGLSSRCEGMSIEQMLETMKKFYRDNPQWRDIKPAVVLTVVIPRLRRGLPPFPPFPMEEK